MSLMGMLPQKRIGGGEIFPTIELAELFAVSLKSARVGLRALITFFPGCASSRKNAEGRHFSLGKPRSFGSSAYLIMGARMIRFY